MMDDLIERLRAPLPSGLCGQSMGCNAASICLCSHIEDQRETLIEAADEITALRTSLATLEAALAKIMPIRVHNGPDYAEVYFADGSTHSTQAMTMNPQDWLDLQAAYDARAAIGEPYEFSGWVEVVEDDRA